MNALPAARRRLGWKIAASLGVVVLGLLAVSIVWIHSVSGKKWTLLRERVQKVVADANRRETSRPILHGETLQGRAWDDYTKGLQSCLTDAEASTLSHFPWDKLDSDKAVPEAILSKYGNSIACLRQGARRAEGRFPYAWEEGNSRKSPLDLHASRLGRLGHYQAKLFRLQGRDHDAATMLMEVLQFCRDTIANGTPYSASYVWMTTALNELESIVNSKKLAQSDLREIHRQLEILEGAFPRHGDLLLNWNAWLSKADLEGLREPNMGVSLLGGEFKTSILSLWRYGFSERIATADAQECMQEWFARIAALEDKSWAEEKRASEQIEVEAAQTQNPMVRSFHTTPESSSFRRMNLAYLRLLRMEIEYLDTGEILELRDPFGTLLKHALTGRKLKIWSVGLDGKDDGGDRTKFKDIVHEVER